MFRHIVKQRSETGKDDEEMCIRDRCKAGMVTSRSEGRRAIEQGGVSVDGEKITDIRYNVKKEDITEEGLIVKRGKKKFMKICL